MKGVNDMNEHEIFPNSPIKKVIFQIIFPNLFYLETKIPNIQVRIMEKFPDSALLIQQKFQFSEIGAEKPQMDENENLVNNKIWEFRSKNGDKLTISSNSLSILSENYVTYDNPEYPDAFKNIIFYVLDAFFEEIKLPILYRMGLRYINEFDIKEKTKSYYENLINTNFPLTKFDIASSVDMIFKTTYIIDNNKINLIEIMQPNDKGENTLVLDIDAYNEQIPTEDITPKIDALHKSIDDIFFGAVKDGAIQKMRGE